jgi:pyruvate/2-oxoglutarate/acetoin dehydrogenase E1 component
MIDVELMNLMVVVQAVVWKSYHRQLIASIFATLFGTKTILPSRSLNPKNKDNQASKNQDLVLVLLASKLQEAVIVIVKQGSRSMNMIIPDFRKVKHYIASSEGILSSIHLRQITIVQSVKTMS